MRPMTSPTLLLAASLLLATVPVFAGAPASPETVAPAAPGAVEAPATQDGSLDLPNLPLFSPLAEPTAGSCGGNHTLQRTTFFLTGSQEGCVDTCTDWCDGLQGTVTGALYGRGECRCECCV